MSRDGNLTPVANREKMISYATNERVPFYIRHWLTTITLPTSPANPAGTSNHRLPIANLTRHELEMDRLAGFQQNPRILPAAIRRNFSCNWLNQRDSWL